MRHVGPANTPETAVIVWYVDVSGKRVERKRSSYLAAKKLFISLSKQGFDPHITKRGNAK